MALADRARKAGDGDIGRRLLRESRTDRSTGHPPGQGAVVEAGGRAGDLQAGVQPARHPLGVQADAPRVVGDDRTVDQAAEAEAPGIPVEELTLLGPEQLEAGQVDQTLVRLSFTEVDVHGPAGPHAGARLVKELEPGFQPRARITGARHGRRLMAQAQGGLEPQTPALAGRFDRRHADRVTQGVHILVGLCTGQSDPLAAAGHPALHVEAPDAGLGGPPEHRQGDLDLHPPAVILDVGFAAPQCVPI